ncbi:MAG: MCE family protein [Nitrosomonadales bacterium]|nr:MAG: MCE family protein [Nitrosomonadales bacterium]
MENRAHALIAGLFAILLSMAVVAAYWWLSGASADRRDYYVLSNQPVTGLNPQATVKFRGVNVGQVAAIEFDPANPMSILIRVSVDKTLRMTRGTYAQLKSQGLTGLAYIELDDNGSNPEMLAMNDSGASAPVARIPLRASDMDNLIDSGKLLVERSKLLVENSIRLVEGGNRLFDPHNLERIEHTLDNLDQATQELAPLLAAMKQTSERVNGALSDEHQQRLLAVADSAHAALQQAGPMIQDMRRATADFHELSTQLQRTSSEIAANVNGETLPRLNQLSFHLTRDAKRLDTLMQELEQNPQSLIFGKAQPMPGPGEPGFSERSDKR